MEKGSNDDGAEFPPVFSHSVKIEQTAKGARITVHVHANSKQEAIAQAIQMYEETATGLGNREIPVAPVEVGK